MTFHIIKKWQHQIKKSTKPMKDYIFNTISTQKTNPTIYFIYLVKGLKTFTILISLLQDLSALVGAECAIDDTFRRKTRIDSPIKRHENAIISYSMSIPPLSSSIFSPIFFAYFCIKFFFLSFQGNEGRKEFSFQWRSKQIFNNH